MKKILFTFILFLGCTVSVLADSTADALRWNYQLSYHNATHTQAVGNWVYTVFNGNLLAYDSETGQSYTLRHGHKSARVVQHTTMFNSTL